MGMNHPGMRYSLVSREIIADSVEAVVLAHAYDGLIGFASCDKTLSGLLMAMARIGPTPEGGSCRLALSPEDAEARALLLRWCEPLKLRFEQDAWYIEHWSLGLDAKILLATFTTLFRPAERPAEDTMNIERARARQQG